MGSQASVTGTQGMGVRTPSAAAVAPATVGLASDMHIPNGGILTTGAAASMLPAGLPSTSTRDVGRTTSELGAAPNVQVSIADIVTLGLPMPTVLSWEPLRIPLTSWSLAPSRSAAG